jgi:hypothetical protein
MYCSLVSEMYRSFVYEMYCSLVYEIVVFYTVRTVAADLRRGEHIPKLQTNIGRKSTLHVLRQPRSKWGGGGDGCRTMQCHAVSLTEQHWHIERKQNNEFYSMYHPIRLINYSIFYFSILLKKLSILALAI